MAVQLALCTRWVERWIVERDVRCLLQGQTLTPPTCAPRYQPTDWAQYEAKHVLVGEAADTARAWWRERARQVQARVPCLPSAAGAWPDGAQLSNAACAAAL